MAGPDWVVIGALATLVTLAVVVTEAIRAHRRRATAEIRVATNHVALNPDRIAIQFRIVVMGEAAIHDLRVAAQDCDISAFTSVPETVRIFDARSEPIVFEVFAPDLGEHRWVALTWTPSPYGLRKERSDRWSLEGRRLRRPRWRSRRR